MVQNEPGLGETFRGDDRDRRLRHRVCFLLDVGSLCLFALFLIHLLPLLMESKPLHAEWQGQAVETMEQRGILAFLGFILLHLAVLLNPRKQTLRRRLRQVRHLAMLAVLGYLLLIPLQLASSFTSFSTLQMDRNEKASQVTRLMEVRELINRSKNNQDLNLRLRVSREPGLSAEQKTMDFGELRQELLRENDLRQGLLVPKIKDNSKQLSALALMVSRLAAALGWSVAFAAGAVPWGWRRPLLEGLMRLGKDSPE
jgi:hypothetical protein